MKRLLIFITSIFLLGGCGVTLSTKKLSGVIVTETFNIPDDYSVLKVSHAIDVEYSDEVEVMTVRTDSVVFSDFKFSLSDGELLIGKKSDVVSIYDGDAYLQVLLPVSRKLSHVQISGASTFNSETTLKARDMNIVLSGASSLSAPLQAERISVVVSGASSALVTGKADELSLVASGASKISKSDTYLTATNVTVSASGASSITVGCTDAIVGNASGASKIVYYGDCSSSVSTSGASGLEHR